MHNTFSARLDKLNIKKKAIFVIATITILSGCLVGRPTAITTPDTTLTQFTNKTEVQDPTATPEIASAATDVLTQLLNGDRRQRIIFAEFRLENQGIYITSPFDEWATHQVISNQQGHAFYHFPSFSPDGSRIMFTYNDGTGFRIFTMSNDGTDLRLLIRSDQIARNQRYPSWSPDGSRILFTVGNKLYTASSKGSHVELLEEMRGLSYPAWSPNGTQVAYLAEQVSNEQPGSKIFVIDDNGKNPRAITEAIAGNGKISWSPDGKQIAFQSLDGCGDISTVDVETRAVENVTNTPHLETDPTWSPDGNYIAFASSPYSACENYGATSTYVSAKLFWIDLGSYTIGESILLQSVETSLYEPSWWPTVVLLPNWKYRVTNAGSDLNVRDAASTSANSLVKLQEGSIFTALEGPVENDNYQWWRIRTSDGIEGWCVDVPGWYMFESAGLNP
jgi:dipeptidyl aminopeptidase/acylaminoacyl peptidase